MSNIEEKVLFNVLKSIALNTGDEYKIAPDKEYLKALEVVGLIELGWDNSITNLGRLIYNHLNNEGWN